MIGRPTVIVTPSSVVYLSSLSERTAARFIGTPCRAELATHIGETVTVTLDIKTTTPTQVRVYPYQSTGISIAQSHYVNTIGGVYQTFTFVDVVKDWAGDIVANNGGTIGVYDNPGTGGPIYVRNLTVSSGSGPIDLTCLADSASISHGRSDTTSQPDASTITIDLSWRNDVDTFPTAVEIGATIDVDVALGAETFRRFSGQITDVDLAWEDVGVETPDHVVGQIMAAGRMAGLGRRVIGDEPWPQELDGARVSRIMSLAGVNLNPGSSDPGTVQILPRDVDKQPALDLARAVADDAGGLLWEDRHGAVFYADADHRRGTIVKAELDACDLLVSPTWIRNLDGLTNDVSIGYGVAPEGGEQPRYTDSRQDSIDRFGRYDVSLTTQLAALADASALATLLLTRNSSPVWVLSSIPIALGEVDADTTRAVLSLEVNDLITVTGLPAAGSAPTSATLWVEGWQEVLDPGAHDLELVVSGFCRTSPPPRWDDVDPSWTWNTVPAALTWDAVACLGPPVDRGRWADVPASLRWDAVPASVTWDTWEDR